MRKRLLVMAVAFAATVGVWGSFARSTADACGSVCGMSCGNRCEATCTGCTISECGASAGKCCEDLIKAEGGTPACPAT